MTTFWEGDAASRIWRFWTGEALYQRVSDIALDDGAGELGAIAWKLVEAIEREHSASPGTKTSGPVPG
jgi:hypothetical protein